MRGKLLALKGSMQTSPCLWKVFGLHLSPLQGETLCHCCHCLPSLCFATALGVSEREHFVFFWFHVPSDENCQYSKDCWMKECMNEGMIIITFSPIYILVHGSQVCRVQPHCSAKSKNGWSHSAFHHIWGT
jgi:hypothetical protein